METIETDVVIIGASTSGSYTSWLLGKKGVRCVIVEKEKIESLGRAIGPFHVEEVALERFGLPYPPDEEILHIEKNSTTWSPGGDAVVEFEFPTLVLDKPHFIRRFAEYAKDAGAEILEETSFESIIWEKGIPSGVIAVKEAEGSPEKFHIKAKILIDASGIEGVLRCAMPGSPWFENDRISDKDTIFVYMETWEDIQGRLNLGFNSFIHYQAWCAPGPGDTTIVGIGMAGSSEAARERHRRFVEKVGLKGKVLSSTNGRIPYRRPPFSLVDNGVMVAGDAAFQNKPFSGEGVTSAFTACQIVADVAYSALEKDDVTRESLWDYNRLYFSGQGAKFAQIMATVPATMKATEDEMNYLLKTPGFMTAESSIALQRDYETGGGSLDLNALSYLARCIASRKISPRLIGEIIFSGFLGSALRKHYENYPEHPAQFYSWKKRAEALWRRAEAIRYSYFENAPLT